MMCAVTNLKRKRDTVSFSSSSNSNSSSSSEREMKSFKESVELRPHEHLLTMSNGNIVNGSELVNFFHQYTANEVEAYGMEVTRAVRSRNLDKLKELHRQGQPMQCSNRFGESILHMACRQGNLEMVQYMIKEGRVSLRLRDDFGRTPLHDAFWSASPNFDLVDFLIKECPILLFICDKRGHSPLQYVRMEHESLWTSFLKKRREVILQGKEDLAKQLA